MDYSSKTDLDAQLLNFKNEVQEVSKELEFRTRKTIDNSLDFMYFKLLKRKKEIQSKIDCLKNSLDPDDDIA